MPNMIYVRYRSFTNIEISEWFKQYWHRAFDLTFFCYGMFKN